MSLAALKLAMMVSLIVLKITPMVGHSPLTMRYRVEFSDLLRGEACIHFVRTDEEGFERHFCRDQNGINPTYWIDLFTIQDPGEYHVWVTLGKYRTPEVPIRVIGLGGS